MVLIVTNRGGLGSGRGGGGRAGKRKGLPISNCRLGGRGRSGFMSSTVQGFKRVDGANAEKSKRRDAEIRKAETEKRGRQRLRFSGGEVACDG